MPEIPLDVIEKIKKRDLQNIARQAAEGRALSSAQMRRLDQSAVDVAGGDGAMLRVEPCHVGQDYLSQILGITDRRIRQLASQGVINKVSKGHYPFPRAVAEYCEYLRHGGGGGSTLKERELQLKCEKLEQDINQRRERIAEEERQRITGDLVDGLQEIRSAYLRMKLNKATVDKLKRAFERAIEKINNAGNGDEE